MKSNLKKRILAFMLCMVMVLSSATSVLADDADAGNTRSVEANQEVNNEPAAVSEEADSTAETQGEPEAVPTESETKQETSQNEQPAVESTQQSEPATAPESAPVQEAMELKQDMKDANGNVDCTVTANIPEGTFSGANTSEVTMEVTEAKTKAAEEIKGLIEKGLAEDKILGDYFLYNISFKVNGETVEPRREIKITFEKKDFKIGDTKKATVFYYNEAYSIAGNQEAEIKEIIQKSDKLEELQNAGQSTDNIDDYDLTEISLKEDGAADKIQTEGRRSTIYGCYIEEDKPEDVTDENTPAQEEPDAVMNYEDDDVIITVSADEEGIIPENSKLQVVPILADDKETKEQYKEVEEQLTKKAANEEYDIAGFIAYDISFIDEQGEKAEPNGNVKVTIEYKNEVLPAVVREHKNLDVTVMHLEENDKGDVKEVVDMVADTTKDATVETTDNAKVKKAEFITDSFSAYSVTWLASTPSIKIENDILKDGSLTVVSTGGAYKNITWYKSDKNTSNGYTAVDRIQFQGDVSNISSDGTKLYPAFDKGARKWYKAEITFNDGTKLTSSPVQVTYYDELQNGSFEAPKSGGNGGQTSGNATNGSQWSNRDYADKGGVWQTTGIGTGRQVGQDIEVLWTGASGNKFQFTNNSSLTAADGVQFAEINCEAAGALYQEVLTIPGTELNVEFYHRARDCGNIKYSYPNTGNPKFDTMYLVIAPASEVQNCTTQDNLKKYLADNGVAISSGAQTSSNQKESSKILKNENGLLVVEITSDSKDWHRVVGEYTPKESLSRFFFVSGAVASNNNTVGNLVDKISFTQDLPAVNDDEFSLAIDKKFEGLDNQTLTEVKNKIQFKISASKADGTELTEQEIMNLFGITTVNGQDMKQYPDGSLHYSLKNVSIGTSEKYTVTITELDAELPNYELVTASKTTVTKGDNKPEETQGTTKAVIESLEGKTTANIEFTNTYNRTKTKNVNFKKVWDDNENQFNTRPDSLEVTLKASIIVDEDGNVVEKPLEEYTQTATLNKGNNWEANWSVPVYHPYNETEVKINYTVVEGDINSGYVYKSPSNGIAQPGNGEDYKKSDFDDVRISSDTTGTLRNRMNTSTLQNTVNSNEAMQAADNGISELGEPAHNKYIQYNENTAEYTLNLDVTGAKGTAQGADILFVIDTSGSMDNGLLDQLKTLLTKNGTGIIDKIFATSGNVNSVAYVSFAGKSQTKVSNWYQTGGKEDLKKKINGLEATGGTNWTYALQQASETMKKKANSNNEKVVIFLSDGAPTYTMSGSEQKGNGSKTQDYYYTDAATVVNNSQYLNKTSFYSVYLTSNTKTGMNKFSGLVNNSELVNGTKLGTALEGILNKVIPTYKNVVITDTLSENVVFAEANPSIIVTKKTAAGVQTILLPSEYKATTTNNTVRVELLGGEALEDKATYTVSFKVKPSDTANEKYSASNDRYPDKGDVGTGSTSAGKDGFYSNVKNQTTVTYTVNDEKGSATYLMPVVQVTMHELSYQKEWKHPDNIAAPTSEVILHVTYTDGTTKDIPLNQENKYQYTEKVPVTKKIKTITEKPIEGYTPSYQITDNGTKAIVTNSYSKVTVNTITVKKEWVGGSTQTPIDVSLYQSANGEDATLYETQTLSEENNWEYTWRNLPKTAGTSTDLITYTYAVREENSPPNYSSNIVYDYGKDETTVTITNIYDSNCEDENYYIVNVLQTENIKLEKTWNDNDDVLGKRPSTLGIKVKDGNDANDLTFYLNAGNFWSKTVRLLKKVNVTYTAEELLDSADYELESMTTDKTDNETVFSFVNNLRTTSVMVHKEWNDGEIATRPDTISFTLEYRENADSPWKMYSTHSMTAEDIAGGSAWSLLIEKLPAIYEYRVSETNVAAGYNTKVSNSENGFTITNTLNWNVIKTSTPIGDKKAEPLAGGEFELKKGNEVIAAGTSNSDGKIEWKLPDGSTVNLNELNGEYTIHETKAPDGYILSGDWTLQFSNGLLVSAQLEGEDIIISSDATDGAVIQITNNAIYELPSTGGSGIYWYSIGGMLLMIAAALILYKNKCREVLKS